MPSPISASRVSNSYNIQRKDQPVGSAIGQGSRVDRYAIGAELGRGGMGVVHAAFDAKLGRRIAIKLVRPPTKTLIKTVQGARARLLREAQALARLSHPNVVALYDFGTTPQGGVYLAMELIDGLCISDYIKRYRPHWRETVDLFVQAGRGLAAAHDAGIIHRDFKPGNVMIGNDGRVRVLDFGLARAMYYEDEPDESHTLMQTEESLLESCERRDEDTPRLLSRRLTDANIVLGTTGYMAPEQLQGLGIDARSDQFAFCVALYDALYGMRPYKGQGVLEIAQSFKDGVIQRPRRTQVPRRISKILERGLSIDPSRRYANMRELLDALQREPKGLGLTGRAVLVAGTAAVIAYGMHLWSSGTIIAAATANASAEAEPTAEVHDVVEGPTDVPTLACE